LEGCSLPQSRSYWTELGYHLGVFVPFFHCFDYSCGVALHLDLGLFLLLLLGDTLSIDYHFLCSTHLCYSLV